MATDAVVEGTSNSRIRDLPYALMGALVLGVIFGAVLDLPFWLVDKYALHGSFTAWLIWPPIIVAGAALLMFAPSPFQVLRVLLAVLAIPVLYIWLYVHAISVLHHRESEFVASVNLFTLGHQVPRAVVLKDGWTLCSGLRKGVSEGVLSNILVYDGVPEGTAPQIVHSARQWLCP